MGSVVSAVFEVWDVAWAFQGRAGGVAFVRAGGEKVTKREAKRYVYQALATEVRHHISNGSEWTYIGDDEKEMPEADTERICTSLEEIADEFERRARRMGKKKEWRWKPLREKK
jgi:hypothetical protein